MKIRFGFEKRSNSIRIIKGRIRFVKGRIRSVKAKTTKKHRNSTTVDIEYEKHKNRPSPPKNQPKNPLKVTNTGVPHEPPKVDRFHTILRHFNEVRVPPDGGSPY